MTQIPQLQKLTDRCVMCGLCSQHCPTYVLSPTESESPRGRIALLNAANEGQLALDETSREHLKHCVGCRSCEDFCPSGVRFTEIMDQGLALGITPDTISQTGQESQPRQLRQLLNLVSQPQWLTRLGRWLGRYQHWGIQRLARKSGILNILGLAQTEALLPSLIQTRPLPGYSPASGEHRGDVALFTGCVSRLFDYEAQNATRLLLNQLGYGVHIPATQTCCGALHRHNGETEMARSMAKTNMDAFASLKIDAIVHTATGCTAQLTEYQEMFTDQAEAKAFSAQVVDINTFLTRIIDNGNWPEKLRPKALPHSVLVHEPCSLRNVLHQAGNPQRLLEMIPGIELQTLPRKLNCCGAGGSYMLTQTDFSRRMRAASLESINEINSKTPSSTLVTTNIGCALHLAAGLREEGQTLEVLHPVSLLARQLVLGAA